jgi:hypothetical protein
VGFLRPADGSLASFTFFRLVLPCLLLVTRVSVSDPLAGWLVRRANCDQLPFAFGMVSFLLGDGMYLVAVPYTRLL